MNCQNHPEVPAVAYCRACGQPVCDACRHDAYGTVYCAEHAPAPAAYAPPPPAPGVVPGPGGTPPGTPPGGPSTGYVYADISPGLAMFLGLIPGVGAIYNGQYAKGLVHAVIWGVLMSIADSRASHGLEAVFIIAVIAWWAYMAFEAYHTAIKRRRGEPVDEYSSLINLRGRHEQAPVAGITLIVLGILLLLHTLDLLNFEYVARYWPVLLIAAGAYLLYGRFSGHGAAEKEVRHEGQ